MIAVALLAIPVAAYLWILLHNTTRARDELPVLQEPRFTPTQHARTQPYSWGADEDLFEWLVAHKGLGRTLTQIRALDTTEEPVT